MCVCKCVVCMPVCSHVQMCMHMCTYACESLEVDQICSLAECTAYIEAELSLNLELIILSWLAGGLIQGFPTCVSHTLGL